MTENVILLGKLGILLTKLFNNIFEIATHRFKRVLEIIINESIFFLENRHKIRKFQIHQRRNGVFVYLLCLYKNSI